LKNKKAFMDRPWRNGAGGERGAGDSCSAGFFA